MALTDSSRDEPQLKPGLTLTHAVALVAGTVIGTGVFLKTGLMAATTGSAGAVFLAWIVAGALSIMGALTYAELASLFPAAGGEYVYLRRAYGDLPAFLYGWTRFAVAAPGSIAAYAVGTATFLSGALRIEAGARAWLALALVAAFTAINCLSVRFGGRAQSVLTAIKALLILGLAAGALAYAAHAPSGVDAAGATLAGSRWGAFGAAMIAALWAYDGWNNLPMVAGEVRDAPRNVPRALVLGMLAVIALYSLANWGYFHALSFAEIAGANSRLHPEAPSVAALAAGRFLGADATVLLSLVFALSALGAMHGSILTGARVPYAMARDGLFFRALGQVSSRSGVPARAILAQGAWACLLALTGSFDQLTDYVVFSSWIFYGLCGASVFIFRRRFADAPRAFRVTGYPVLPALFVAASVALLGNTLVTSPRDSLIGLGLILAGVPLYYLGFHRRRREAAHAGGALD